MKQRITYLVLALFFCIVKLNAQVGINTIAPQANLDVRESNPSSPSASAGIAIPQISNLPSSGNRAGQMVYYTLENRYYFYDGSEWRCLSCSNYGEIRQSFADSDYGGWIKLDGRPISSLTAKQQARAISLGFTSNLPNATNAYLVQNGTTLGNVSGSNIRTINRNQLPNITLAATGTTNMTGAHTHSYTDRGDTSYTTGYGSGNPIADNTSGTYTTGSAGNHSHTVTATTESLNGGLTQENLDVTPKSLSVNTFVYLGI